MVRMVKSCYITDRMAVLLLLAFLPTLQAFDEVCRSSRCDFTLDVRWSRTMTYRHENGQVYNVQANSSHLTLSANSWHHDDPHVGTNVNADSVIIADGYPRDVIVVNGRFPAPTLHVNKGAKVTINVYNNLHTEAFTLHWHGMDQRGSVWMDGVPYVTQCPVQAGSRFSYKFTAGPAGTHWYGAAEPSLRLDGLAGMLVVHTDPPDLSTDVALLLTDWFHVDGRTLHATSPYVTDNVASTGEYVTHHVTGYQKPDLADKGLDRVIQQDPTLQSQGDREGSGDLDDDLMYVKPKRLTPVSNLGAENIELQNDDVSGSRLVGVVNPYPSSFNHMYDSAVLINGRSGTNNLPVTTLRFLVNSKYRLRFAHAGMRGPLRVSLDMHKLRVVAADGTDIEDIIVDSLLIFPGETWDVIIDDTSETSPRTSWLHVNDAQGSAFYGHALVVNEEEVDTVSPGATLLPEGVTPPPLEYAPKRKTGGCSSARPCIQLNCPYNFVSHSYTQCIPADKLSSKGLDIYKYFWLNDVHSEERFLNLAMKDVPSINGIRYANPGSPLHLSGGQKDKVCEAPCTGNHRIQLPFNKTIDLIISNYDSTNNLSPLGQYSVHLHGPPFALLKLGYAEVNSRGDLVSNAEVTCMTSSCIQTRWREKGRSTWPSRPVLRNNVVIPALGYVILRLRTDTPGYWMLESESDLSGEGGMKVILEIAPELVSQPPEDHHVCGYSVEEVALNRIGHGEDHVVIKTSHLIGVGVGSLVLGMFAAILGVIVAVKAGHKHNKRHPSPPSDYGKTLPSPYHNNSVSRLSSL